jgi:hypothetical protein
MLTYATWLITILLAAAGGLSATGPAGRPVRENIDLDEQYIDLNVVSG